MRSDVFYVCIDVGITCKRLEQQITSLKTVSIVPCLPIGYSVIVALTTGLPIGYSVIVTLTGLPIG